MAKVWLVLRHEIRTTLSSKSFLFGAFGVPLVVVLLVVVISSLGRSGEGFASLAGGGSDVALKVEGYVDGARLVQTIPDDVPAGVLVPYANEASAHRALREGAISAYYVISPDYVETGNLLYVNAAYSPADRGQAWAMERTLTANLLGNAPELIAHFRQPMELEVEALAPATPRLGDSAAAFYLPYGTTMILYVVILTAASLLLNSINKEKTNRVMEVLMSSVSPRDLLTGKILGLGLLGLLQAAAWLGTAYGALRLGGQAIQLPPELQLPPSVLAWGMVFFLLGYALYASLMAALGAVVPNLKEASQATFLVIWPMIVPLMLISILIEQPHGLLAVILSLFPPTASVTMMLRLSVGGVPLWQPALAALLLLATAYWVIRAVAGMFRAQTLLSGQPFSAKRFVAALVGR
ncbi:MAG: ABC transporter permease [Chloroflexi bacterium]|nr:ABC transporter permease [Chloroflexota bacterium]